MITDEDRTRAVDRGRAKAEQRARGFLGGYPNGAPPEVKDFDNPWT